MYEAIAPATGPLRVFMAWRSTEHKCCFVLLGHDTTYSGPATDEHPLASSMFLRDVLPLSQTTSCHVGLEILTSVAMKSNIFWDIVFNELQGVISQKIEFYMTSYSRRLQYESLLHGNFKSYIMLHIDLGFTVYYCNCRLYRQNKVEELCYSFLHKSWR